MRTMTFSTLLMLAMSAGTAWTQPVRVQKAKTPRKLVALTSVEVALPSGPDKMTWGKAWNDTAPVPLDFRWKTGYSNVGSAVWQVTTDPETWKVLASGDAGRPPAPDGMSRFSVDFRSIAGNTNQRPLHYYLRVVTYKAAERAAAPATGRTIGRQPGRLARRTSKAPTRLTEREQAGPPSMPVVVSILPSGPVTEFTPGGLRPELYNAMPIQIDLNTLKIGGTGGDEDPYLLVVAFFADGTTIVPKINLAKQRIEFPTSSVRIQSPTKTHENVPVDVDPGDELKIPASTGHFEATIRPIGLELAHQHGLSASQQRQLREKTLVGILVIGMEEDALPSTDVMNETRNELVSALQSELDRIVRGITVSLANPTKIPNRVDAVNQIRDDLKKRLVDSAKARTLEELQQYLAIHGFPAIVLVPGALNADDYIGSGVALFDYEQLLQAGSNGLPIRMKLDQNPDEDLHYRIEGRIRVKP